MHFSTSALLSTLLLPLALAAPSSSLVSRHPHSRHSHPLRRSTSLSTLASTSATRMIGVVTDHGLIRDSCNSVSIASRVLWTCRDTQTTNSLGLPSGGLVSSTASWTNLSSPTSSLAKSKSLSSLALPLLPVSNIYGGTELSMYGNQDGNPFYPIPAFSDCPEAATNAAGSCSDGSRYAIWEDSPPMVTTAFPAGGTVAYTWIRATRINSDLSIVGSADPATVLYRVSYLPSEDESALPSVEVVDAAFWKEGEVPYGHYGNVVRDGVAYLFAKPSSGHVALAKVAIGDILDQTKYQYWVAGSWTAVKPSLTDPNINLENAGAGGQGTFYYSEPWKSYVWIGQAYKSVSAEFFIATAPKPEGPWSIPQSFYKGLDGNSALPAYSLQAHPALVREGLCEIYLTYTKADKVGSDSGVYTTPLIHVTWAT